MGAERSSRLTDAGYPTKATLRRIYIESRKAFKNREPANQALADRIAAMIRQLNPKQVAGYRAVNGEAEFPATPGAFYPVLQGDHLAFYKDTGQWRTNRFGIEEPVIAQALDPKAPTLIFCPAVAVDHCGQRLGMGKGYYDKYFAKHPRAIRVGVIFQIQLSADPLPAESWDQALDWIVTENLTLRSNTRSL